MEMLPDVQVICGGQGPAGGLQASVSVTLNAPIGSRELNQANAASEALLLVDEPAPSQLIGQPVGQTVPGATAIQGVRTSSTSIAFNNVTLAQPSETFVQHRLRITNVRVNAGDRPQGFAVVMTLSVGGLPVLGNSLLVAEVGPALNYQVRGTADTDPPALVLRSCDGNKSPVTAETPRDFNLKFSESFAAEFRKRNIATSVNSPLLVASQNNAALVNGFGVETGFYHSAFAATSAMNQAGLATQGTRLMARFNAIPGGVQIWVTTAPVTQGTSGTGITARLAATDANGAGAFSAVVATAGPWSRLNIAGGSAVAVWEVFESSPTEIETLSFGVIISVPPLNFNSGTLAVQGLFAPLQGGSVFGLGQPSPTFSEANLFIGPVAAEVRACEGALTISTNSPLPAATAGVPYVLSLLAGGGSLPLTWSISRGTLPPGLTLAPNGLLSGTPTESGPYSFTLKVTDARGATVEKDFTMTVDRGLVITTACPLPNAGLGLGYVQVLSATGGQPPYVWAIRGSLPPGLSLSPSGQISGSASTPGVYSFTLLISDARSQSGTKECSLRVLSPLRVAPSSISFSAAAGAAPPPPQFVNLINDLPGQNWSARVVDASWLRITPAAGRMPGLLELSANISGLRPGSYSGSLSLFTEGTPAQSLGLTVSLTVTESIPAQLAAEPAGIVVSTPRETAAVDRVVHLQNRGSGAISFTATLEAPAGSNWVTLAGGPRISGRIAAGAPSRLRLRFSPDLVPGVYTARVRVRNDDTGDAILVPLSLGVSSRRETMAVEPASVSLTAVPGVPSGAASQFNVISTGGGEINWQAAVSTDPALPSWLTISQRGGRATPGSPSSVEIATSASGLSPGRYMGEIMITAPGSDTPPRTIIVTLIVADAVSVPPPEIQPSALVFMASMFSQPGPQSIVIHNNSRSAITFDSQLAGDAGVWSVTLPLSRIIPAGGSSRIEVSVPNVARAQAGVSTAQLIIQTSSDSQLRRVDLVLGVITGGAAEVQGPGRGIEAVCPPGGLRVFSVLTRNGFAALAGQGFPVALMVLDAAGRPVTSGGFTASLAGAAAALTHVGTGRWLGTIRVPPGANGPALLSLYGDDSGRTGCQDLTGVVESSPAPSIAEGGVVSTASFAPFAPLAAGGMFAIFGSRLTEGSATATLPLPSELGSTRVRVGPSRVPLFFAGDPGGFSQINGVLPYGLAPNVIHQLVVNSPAGMSTAELLVADAQPGVFTVNQRGTGQAIAVLGSSPTVIADSGNAVARGEALIIYCEGLGPVMPRVEAGQVAPSAPLAQVELPVRVTIGGREAPVFFAGLTPGLTGLYQINVIVASDTPAGDVPLVVQVAGRESSSVTVAVR
jgi:uncharacterized protein (TIGR03437 family)